VFVVTTFGRIADGPLKLFRSYGFDRDETPIWQAARATSAAPAFFPPARVDIPAPAGWYLDGGLRANNPTGEAIVEGKSHWDTRKCFIVSVGTGTQNPVDFIGKTTIASTSQRPTIPTQSDDQESTNPESKPRKESLVRGFIERAKTASHKVRVGIGRPTAIVADKATELTRIPDGIKASLHIMNAIVNLSTSSDGTHIRVYQEATSKDESAQFPYFRFNVLRGMDDIGLEEWRKVEVMADVTRSYLQSPLVEDELKKCAGGLVNPTAFEST
jgi:Patatin-like phospholipase